MTIRVEQVSRQIARVVIDNESKRNALNLSMFEALAALWSGLAADPTLRAVVITGAGDRAFCAGADLSAKLGRHPGIDELVDKALLKTVLFPKPLIAAISGDCIAGGLELALSADIRIANERARFGFPEVGVGIVPSGGGTMKLVAQIGHARAMDLLLTGRLIDGRKAAQMGLVTEAVEPPAVMDLAMERAALIAANSPAAVAATKKAALGCYIDAWREREIAERALVAAVRATGHDEIGIAAFLEGREPEFDDRPLL